MCHWKKISPYKNKWLFVIFILDHKVTQKFEQQSILQAKFVIRFFPEFGRNNHTSVVI